MAERYYGKVPDYIIPEMQKMRDDGLPLKYIAEKFHVSEKTVANYTLSPRKKLGYSDLDERDKEIVRLRDEKFLTWREISIKMHIGTGHAGARYRRYKANEANC